MKGHETVLVDLSDDVLEKSKSNITKSLGRIQQKFSQDPKYGYLEVRLLFAVLQSVIIYNGDYHKCYVLSGRSETSNLDANALVK